jgi:hypothetical protein
VSSYDWRQHQLAESAEEIRRLASELYERTLTVQDYYADTAGTWIAPCRPTTAAWQLGEPPTALARRIRELGAAAGEEPAAPEQIDVVARDPKMLEPSSRTKMPMRRLLALFGARPPPLLRPVDEHSSNCRAAHQALHRGQSLDDAILGLSRRSGRGTYVPRR